MSDTALLADQIRQQREALAALEAEFAAKRAERIPAFASEVIEDAEKEGLDIAAVVAAITAQTGVKVETAKSRKQAKKPRRSYVDETGNVYKGGKIPGWMAEQMLINGYDPTEKGAAREFADKHMLVQEAA